MIEHEQLPPDFLSDTELAFIAETEHVLRPRDSIITYFHELLQNEPDLYRTLSKTAAELAPGNPHLHSFYFTEFLLLTQAVRRIKALDYLDKAWADSPPILSS